MRGMGSTVYSGPDVSEEEVGGGGKAYTWLVQSTVPSTL